MNTDLYKGLDLIYKLMNLVNRRNIHWKIFGIGERDILKKTVEGVLKIKNKQQNIKFYGQIKADRETGFLFNPYDKYDLV